jgi:membrane protease YdiL (CAAX protease family)
MDEKKEELKITASLVWSPIGFYQQIFIWLFTLSIPAVVNIVYILNPANKAGLFDWLLRVKALFNLNHFIIYVLWGLIGGAVLSFLFLLLTWLITGISGETAHERLNRNDELIPRSPAQKRWAVLINLSASFVEEILFRAYLFMALINVWNHWIWAAVLVSAIFAFVHTNIQQLSATIWIFITSFFLCLFTIKLQGLAFPWGMHLSVNLMNLFIFPKLSERLFNER